MASPDFREVNRILKRIPDRNNIPGLTSEGMKDFFRLAVQNMEKHCQKLENPNYDSHLRGLVKTERAEAEVLIHEIIDIWLEHMANKPIAPDSYEYQSGLLAQWCSRFDSGCDWKDEKLRKELHECPECGSPVSKDCILKFGGGDIKFKSGKNRFYFGHVYDDGGLVYEHDFPDTIIFMIRHGNFWRQI